MVEVVQSPPQDCTTLLFTSGFACLDATLSLRVAQRVKLGHRSRRRHSPWKWSVKKESAFEPSGTEIQYCNKLFLKNVPNCGTQKSYLNLYGPGRTSVKRNKGGGGDRELNPWELENPAVGEIMEGPKLALPLVAPHSSPDPYIKQLFTHENFGLDYWWLQIVKFFTRLH